MTDTAQPTADVAERLVAQLVNAATSAITNQRPELTRNQRELKSVMLELPIRTTGTGVQVGSECELYIQRRVSTSAAAGLRG